MSEEFAQRMAPLKIVDQVLKGNSNGRCGKLNDRRVVPGVWRLLRYGVIATLKVNAFGLASLAQW